MSSLPKQFPLISVEKDNNPAIRLFGKRFISEQTVVEYLTEFLALLFSPKKISEREFKEPLPSLEVLNKWAFSDNKLKYRPPVKLNLKLFALLSVSRVDLRHKVFKEHYEVLLRRINNQTKTNSGQIKDAIICIEELLQGFQGAGVDRTWCAQTFFPVTNTLLTKEAIWSKSNEKKVEDWYDGITKNLDFTKHNFMARGGELLYLQLCNAFLTKEIKINNFIKRLAHSGGERDLPGLANLHQLLQKGLRKLEGQYTGALDQLVNYIESLDVKTHELTNDADKWLSCEWCPRDSWQEGYLFAVEINRLLCALLDPIERLQLLMTGCTLQVLRSLNAQSIRYVDASYTKTNGSALGYAWILSPPETSSRQQRLLSQRNLQVVQGVIQKALRHEELQEIVRLNGQNKDLYKEADTKYGHKLFVSLGKKLGMIVPYKGPGARMIMTDTMLRYMVLVLLQPGERCTYDNFLERLYLHFGIAIEGKQLGAAMAWSGLPVNNSVHNSRDSWLAEMLRAGGFLTELSDACSIVCNTFGQDQ